MIKKWKTTLRSCIKGKKKNVFETEVTENKDIILHVHNESKNLAMLFISGCSLLVTLGFGWLTYNISNENKQINARQERLIYEVSSKDNGNKYNLLMNNDTTFNANAPTVILHNIVGTFNNIYLIKFNNDNIFEVSSPPAEWFELMGKQKIYLSLDWQTYSNTDFTLYKDKGSIYDYVYLYIKEGNTEQRLETIYIKIDYDKDELSAVSSDAIKLSRLDMIALEKSLTEENPGMKDMVKNYFILSDYIEAGKSDILSY